MKNIKKKKTEGEQMSPLVLQRHPLAVSPHSKHRDRNGK